METEQTTSSIPEGAAPTADSAAPASSAEGNPQPGRPTPKKKKPKTSSLATHGLTRQEGETAPVADAPAGTGAPATPAAQSPVDKTLGFLSRFSRRRGASNAAKAFRAGGVPKPEHPRPQMARSEWLNLNGLWEFEIDAGDSGFERKLHLTERRFDQEILVPYAPESQLSGIEHVDFMEAVWYRRKVTVPKSWKGKKPLLHFGAVDHDATVWVNGVEVVRHRGGFTPFTADLEGVAAPGDTVTVTVRARDHKNSLQARGKQATWYENTHCQYTRTTGIWQTVWLEGVSPTYIKRIKATPNLASGSLAVETQLSNNDPGSTITARLTDGEGTVVEASARADLDLGPAVHLVVPADRLRPWSVEDPHLYGLVVELRDAKGRVVDTVDSYAGIRSVSIDGNAVLINGKHVFQRLVLDQGYWPESLMTAPDEQALVRDIELSMKAGFNGARLHQKVFEERFLYHADRMGYLVWGEFGDWGVAGQGAAGNNIKPTASFVAEWMEAVARDYNHPSIVGWCPLNETYEIRHDRMTVLDDVTQAMFKATKLADPTRPVVDASGYAHRVLDTDIYDSHSYVQKPRQFRKQMAGLAQGDPYVNKAHDKEPYSTPYKGQPYFVSEYGGIWWNPQHLELSGHNEAESWGYGQRVRNEKEFYDRFEGLTRVLLNDRNMFGYCYTQLTDVFQEENGIYRFDRSEKLDIAKIRAVQEKVAAYEKRGDVRRRRR